jgi:sortase B
MDMKARTVGKWAIKLANAIINLLVTTIAALLIAYAAYALWDSTQIYRSADKSNYVAYKPTAANEGKSFGELQALNPEIFAWLSVYGTNIDYPVTQGQDNVKYVNTNAEGLYSLAGAIFLDCNNDKGFNDFNNILYGHHMAKKAMFGEIGMFSEKEIFDARRYGNLYFDMKDHGIEFFAFIHCDAYDTEVFTANIVEAEARRSYLENLWANAIYGRDIGVTIADRVIMLSTCSSSSTNGRDILIGKITDETYADPFLGLEINGGINMADGSAAGGDGQFGQAKKARPLIILAIMTPIMIILVIYYIRRHKKQNRGGKE